MNIVKLYSDGSALKVKKTKETFAGCGFRTMSRDGEIFEHSEMLEPPEQNSGIKAPTNQIAELMGFKRGIEYILNSERNIIDKSFIYAYLDSKYVINIFTSYIRMWKRNGWRRVGGQEIENLDLIKSIHDLLEESGHKVIYMHVRAHQPQPQHVTENDTDYEIWYGNMRADELSRTASEQCKSKNYIEPVKATKVSKPKKSGTKTKIQVSTI